MFLTFIFENVRWRLQRRPCRWYKSIYMIFFFLRFTQSGRADETRKNNQQHEQTIFRGFEYFAI